MPKGINGSIGGNSEKMLQDLLKEVNKDSSSIEKELVFTAKYDLNEKKYNKAINGLIRSLHSLKNSIENDIDINGVTENFIKMYSQLSEVQKKYGKEFIDTFGEDIIANFEKDFNDAVKRLGDKKKYKELVASASKENIKEMQKAEKRSIDEQKSAYNKQRREQEKQQSKEIKDKVSKLSTQDKARDTIKTWNQITQESKKLKEELEAIPTPDLTIDPKVFEENYRLYEKYYERVKKLQDDVNAYNTANNTNKKSYNVDQAEKSLGNYFEVMNNSEASRRVPDYKYPVELSIQKNSLSEFEELKDFFKKYVEEYTKYYKEAQEELGDKLPRYNSLMEVFKSGLKTNDYKKLIREAFNEGDNIKASLYYEQLKKNIPNTKFNLSTVDKDLANNYEKYLDEGHSFLSETQLSKSFRWYTLLDEVIKDLNNNIQSVDNSIEHINQKSGNFKSAIEEFNIDINDKNSIEDGLKRIKEEIDPVIQKHQELLDLANDYNDSVSSETRDKALKEWSELNFSDAYKRANKLQEAAEVLQHILSGEEMPQEVGYMTLENYMSSLQTSTEQAKGYVKKSDDEIYASAMEMAKKRETVLKDIAQKELDIANKSTGEVRETYAKMAQETYKMFQEDVPDGSYRIDEKITDTDKLIKDLQKRIEDEKDPKILSSLNEQLDEARIKLTTLVTVFDKSYSNTRVKDYYDSDVIERYNRKNRTDYTIGESHFNIAEEDKEYWNNITKGIKSEKDLTKAIEQRKKSLVDLYKKRDEADEKASKLNFDDEDYDQMQTAWNTISGEFYDAKLELKNLLLLQENWNKSAKEAASINVNYLDEEWREEEQVMNAIEEEIEQVIAAKEKLNEEDNNSSLHTKSLKEQIDFVKELQKVLKEYDELNDKLNEGDLTEKESKRLDEITKKYNELREVLEQYEYIGVKLKNGEIYDITEASANPNNWNTRVSSIKSLDFILSEEQKTEQRIAIIRKAMDDMGVRQTSGKTMFDWIQKNCDETIQDLFRVSEGYQEFQNLLRGLTVNSGNLVDYYANYDLDVLNFNELTKTQKEVESFTNAIEEMMGSKWFREAEGSELLKTYRDLYESVRSGATDATKALEEFNKVKQETEQSNTNPTETEEEITSIEKKYEELIKLKSAINKIYQNHPNEDLYHQEIDIPGYDDLEKEGFLDLIKKYYNPEEVHEIYNEVKHNLELIDELETSWGEARKAEFFSKEFSKQNFDNQLKFFDEIAKGTKEGKKNFKALGNEYLNFSFILEDGSEKNASSIMDLNDAFGLFSEIRDKIASIKVTPEYNSDDISENLDASLIDLGNVLRYRLDPIVKTIHEKLSEAFELDPDVLLSSYFKLLDKLNEADSDISGDLATDTVIDRRYQQKKELSQAFYSKLKDTEAPTELINEYNRLMKVFDNDDTIPTVAEAIDLINKKAEELNITFDETSQKWKKISEETSRDNQKANFLKGKSFEELINIKDIEKGSDALNAALRESMEHLVEMYNAGDKESEEYYGTLYRIIQLQKEMWKFNGGTGKSYDGLDYNTKQGKKLSAKNRAKMDLQDSIFFDFITHSGIDSIVTDQVNQIFSDLKNTDGSLVFNEKGNLVSLKDFKELLKLRKEYSSSTTTPPSETPSSSSVNEQLSETQEGLQAVGQAATQEAESVEKSGDAAEEAAKKKEKFAEANKESAKSANKSSKELDKEAENFEDVGDAAEEAEDKILGYIRSQTGHSNSDRYTYLQALSKFEDERFSYSIDAEGNEQMRVQHLINYDKLTKELIKNDTKILDLEYKIAYATESERPGLENNLALVKAETAAYEDMLGFFIREPEYAIGEYQKEVITAQRAINEETIRNFQIAQEGAKTDRERVKLAQERQKWEEQTAKESQKLYEKQYKDAQKAEAEREKVLQYEQKVRNALAKIEEEKESSSIEEKRKTREDKRIEEANRLNKLLQDQTSVYDKIQKVKTRIITLENTKGTHSQEIDYLNKEKNILQQQFTQLQLQIKSINPLLTTEERLLELSTQRLQVEHAISKIADSKNEEQSKIAQQKTEEEISQKRAARSKQTADEEQRLVSTLKQQERVYQDLQTINAAILVTQSKQGDHSQELAFLNERKSFLQQQYSQLMLQIKAIDPLITAEQRLNDLSEYRVNYLRIENSLNDKRITDEATQHNQDAVKAYKELIGSAKEYYELSINNSGDDVSTYELKILGELTDKWKKAKEAKDEYAVDTKGTDASIKTLQEVQSRFTNVGAEVSDNIRTALLKQMSKYEKYDVENKALGEVAKRIDNIRKELIDIRNNGLDLTNPADVARVRQIREDLEYVNSNKGLAEFKRASETRIKQLQLQIRQFQNNNTAMGSEFAKRFEALYEQFNAAQSIAQVDKLKMQFSALEAEVVKAGKTGNSFFTSFVKQLKSANAQLIATYFSLQDFIRYIREAAQTVVQIDSALTELRKVSDASSIRLQENFYKSSETAKELGTTISHVINITSDWARLGYNVDQAEELARITTLFKTVGDNMSADDASSFLVSSLQGFQMATDEAEHIIDVYNEVANNFAIDTAGIGEALKRSAASFNAANTSLEKSVALVTATNTVVQDPDSVGTLWKTNLCLNVQRCA